MYWPTSPEAVPLTKLGWTNAVYLAGGEPLRDPTMVWGTSVELDQMDGFLAAQSRQSNLIISQTHVLILAVGRALQDHPSLNRRVIGQRVYPYRGISIVVPIRRPADGVVDLVFIQDMRELSLAGVASLIWNETHERAFTAAQRRRQSHQIILQQQIRQRTTGWPLWLYKRMVNLGLWVTNHLRVPTWGQWDREMNGANAFVNFLGFNGAPPMISYKPSSPGTNSFSVSVTLGASEQKPVIRDGQIVIAKVAPLFVRVDHRLVNGHQTANFINSLRTYLANPSSLMQSQSSPAAHAA